LELLGAGFELVDIKVSEGDEDIVLVPSSSRQLTGKLRAAFPDAALLVVEVEDIAHDIKLGGQVLRTLDAGADGYFLARSVDELAAIVDRASGRIGSADAPEPAALTAGVADELSDVLDALLVERQNGGAALRREGRRGSDGI
jgi:DNA-binding NarL/FixJ family response regulator